MNLKIFIVSVCVLLVGCHHTRPQVSDSAPSKDIDVSTIATVTPKAEPISRYGNPKSYKALGKVYHVMTSRKGYHEQGFASWYGTKFHGRTTSSGERYNMYAMTAAHKTLPIPSYVRVKNLENHKSIVVKVNDRGPFHKGRIIDLSYAAAKKLGMMKKGTARVDVEVIEPAYTGPVHAYLQVAAYKNKQLAESMATKLRHTLGEQVHIKTQAVKDFAIYKLQVGPLSDKTATQRLLAKLKSAGFAKPFTIKQ